MILKKKTANIKHSQTLGSKNLIVKFNSFEEQLFKRKQELRKNSLLIEQETSNTNKSNSNISELIKKTYSTKISTNTTYDSIDYNKIHEKEMIHVYFKQPEIKFLKPKKNNPIKLILKQNCIENVIERNRMDSHRNKTFDDIKKDVIENYKKHHSYYKTNILTDYNDNNLNEYFYLKKNSEKIPSSKLKDSIINKEAKRFYSDSIENNNNYLSNNIFTKDNLPLIKEKTYFNKKQYKKIGEEKANKILKAIRNMSCREYETLDTSKETINRNNLNRIIELMNIIKLKKYDIENEFDDLSYNPNSYEGTCATKLINSLGPLRLLKQNFKNKTIQKFNNSKGTAFGVPRYNEDIKEYAGNLKYK